MGRLALLLLALAAVWCAGCGGGASSGTKGEEGPIGQGADQYWLFLPKGEPKAVVVFLHGLDESELRPDNHLPWLRHLAAQGDAVVYPRYELKPGTFGAVRHTVAATSAALRRLGDPRAPLIMIGYSRGGRLAVETAAVLPAVVRVPSAVISVFPSRLNPLEEEQIDLATISPSTHIALLAGDRDTDVGSDGARELLRRLQAGGFPPSSVEATVIRSSRGFVADHFAPLRASKAVQTKLWAPADRLVADTEKR
jgi:pimeloyl-ACP methyl ester carboxylesterase